MFNTINKSVKEIRFIYYTKNIMGKLIELLNEYVEKHNKSDLYYKFELENGELYCYNDVSDVLWTMQDEAMVICSKKYGFIEWLVENEKINLDKAKILESGNRAELFEFIERADYMKIRNRSYFSEYNQLLMLLSIKDNPIEFLISILK